MNDEPVSAQNEDAVEAAIDEVRRISELPFELPETFSFGPEFDAEIPRPIPDKCRKGSHIRGRYTVAYATVVVGAACVAAQGTSLVRDWAHFLLPLEYLDYVGFGLMAVSAVIFLVARFGDRTLGYIKDGHPIAARILAIETVERVVAEGVREHRFLATVDYLDPRNESLEMAQIVTDEFSATRSAEHYSSAVGPGDYVTLVSMSPFVDDSTKVYGFLGLDPERELILYRGEPRKATPAWKVMLITSFVVGLIAMLFKSIDVIGRYFPIGGVNGPWIIGVSVGAGIGVVLLLVALVISAKRKKVVFHNTLRDFGLFSKVVLCFAPPLLGAFLGYFLPCYLNAILDSSESRFQEIRVLNFWQETTNFVLRRYEMEYEEFPNGRQEKRSMHPERMNVFSETYAGVIEIGEGRYGMHWIRDVHPVSLIVMKGGEPDDDAALSAEMDSGEVVRLKLAVTLPDGSTMPISDRLREDVIAQLESDVPAAD